MSDNCILGFAREAGNASRELSLMLGVEIKSGTRLDASLPQAQVIIDAIGAAEEKGESGIKPPPVGFFQNNEQSNAWIGARLTPMPIGSYTDSIVGAGARTHSQESLCARHALSPRSVRGSLQEGSIKSSMDHFRTELRTSPNGGDARAGEGDITRCGMTLLLRNGGSFLERAL